MPFCHSSRKWKLYSSFLYINRSKMETPTVFWNCYTWMFAQNLLLDTYLPLNKNKLIKFSLLLSILCSWVYRCLMVDSKQMNKIFNSIPVWRLKENTPLLYNKKAKQGLFFRLEQKLTVFLQFVYSILIMLLFMNALFGGQHLAVRWSACD